jgi:hypothetical protein
MRAGRESIEIVLTRHLFLSRVQPASERYRAIIGRLAVRDWNAVLIIKTTPPKALEELFHLP